MSLIFFEIIMIFFGTGSKTMKTVELGEAECPSCSQPTVFMQLLHKYFHIWWIPVFPIGKVAVAGCKSCNTAWEQQDLPLPLFESVESAKKSSSPPKYLFAGLYIVGIIISIAMFTSWRNDRNTGDYAGQPQVADLYVMSTEFDEEYPHQLFQIRNIDGDSITMMIGSYGYRNPSDAVDAVEKRVTEDLNYFADSVRIAKAALLSLYDTKKVARIIRPEE